MITLLQKARLNFYFCKSYDVVLSYQSWYSLCPVSCSILACSAFTYKTLRHYKNCPRCMVFSLDSLFSGSGSSHSCIDGHRDRLLCVWTVPRQARTYRRFLISPGGRIGHGKWHLVLSGNRQHASLKWQLCDNSKQPRQIMISKSASLSVIKIPDSQIQMCVCLQQHASV